MSGKPKFVFTCQRCGKCCQGREVQVYFCDLERWQREGVFYRFLPHLRVLGDEGGTNQILLGGKAGGKAGADAQAVESGDAKEAPAAPLDACPFYSLEKNECGVYPHRPLSCRAFPLGHDGERYFITDTTCPGLGRGQMTAQRLAIMRDDAATEHLARREVRGTLPPLYSLFTHLLLQDTARRFDGLTEEQKRKLFELFGPGSG